jgi:RNA polymerase sigma-70 factor (ECF subfamily)
MPITPTEPLREVPQRTRRFATTRWSVVLAAGGARTSQAGVALEELCRAYWQPLYAYVRRRGHGPEDAQDLTQEFFARLLARKAMGTVHREKGRFRSFLLASMNHFLADEWDKARTQKRGGAAPLPLDVEAAETRHLLLADAGLTPEKVYDQRWALALLEDVHGRLREKYAAAGNGPLFEALRFTLAGAAAEATYAEVGEKLGLGEGAVKVAAHRLRERYRRALRERVADIVAEPAEVEDELRYLLRALTGGG